MSSRISPSVFSLWRPDRATGWLWLGAVTVSFGVWFSLFLAMSRRDVVGAVGMLVFAGGALLLGVAYGSFFASILLARAAFKRLGDTIPLSLSPAQAVRVAGLAYVVHVAALGVLHASGLWKLSSPWYLGLLVQLWS